MWDDTYVDTGPGYEKRHLRFAQGVKLLKNDEDKLCESRTQNINMKKIQNLFWNERAKPIHL